MLKIMLVRHGVTDWNTLGKIQGISDTHLSPDGLHQARLLAAHCPFEKADAIYSSDLARAKTTALVLSNKFNLIKDIIFNINVVIQFAGNSSAGIARNEFRRLGRKFFPRNG